MFDFDNSYVRDLAGRYVLSQAEPRPAPRLLKLNHALATELGLSPNNQAQNTTPH